MFLLHIFVCMAFKICSHPFFGPHGHPNWDIGIRSQHIEVLVSHNSSQICTVVIVSGKCYLVKMNCVLVEKLPFICTSKIFTLWLVNTIPTPPQNLTETACIETKHLWYLDISALCCCCYVMIFSNTSALFHGQLAMFALQSLGWITLTLKIRHANDKSISNSYIERHDSRIVLLISFIPFL